MECRPASPSPSAPPPPAAASGRSAVVPVAERRPAAETRPVPAPSRSPRPAPGRRPFPAAALPAAPAVSLAVFPAISLAVFLAAGCGPGAPSPADARPVLDSLAVAGPAGPKPLVPDFAPGIHHYAVRCAEHETLTVTAAAGSAGETAGETAVTTLNGAPLPGGRGEVTLRHDQDLAVAVRRGAESTIYAVHCVPLDFPEVEVLTRRPGPADGLLVLDPAYHTEDGERISYLAVLDDHGVPRFRRRIEGGAQNFRWHAAHRRYSYLAYGAHCTDRSGQVGESTEAVLLDEGFEVVDRAHAVGHCATDNHDFLLTAEGNYLFLAYPPAERDFSAVPDESGEYPWSSAEATHDSVIQEVTPAGEVVFEWNSGESRDGRGPPIRPADCRVHRFPDHYAWLNSFSFTAEGNLLASFRGCAQVLEIERPSGRVLRQLGGSAPAIPDGRVHHRFVGDPYPVGFCGQHTPIETGRGANGDLRIALFDNGVHCLEDLDEVSPGPHQNHHSRMVEYRLSGDEAVFLRHHESLAPSYAAGAVQALPNGNRLVTWGRGPGRPLSSLVEVDPTGRAVFEMRVRSPTPGDEDARTWRPHRRALIYRAYRETGLTVPLNLP